MNDWIKVKHEHEACNTNLESLHKSLERLHSIPAPAVTPEIQERIEVTQKLIDYLELRIEMGFPV